MKKLLVLTVFFVAVFLALLIHQPRHVRAALPQFQRAPQEGEGCTAPKAWGQLKGVADRAIAFEDSAGTIRVLDVGPCMRGQTQLIVEITRP